MAILDRFEIDSVEYEFQDQKSHNLAAQYSTSATYAVGDYCIKDGDLYKCITAITTAEAWTAAHWTAAQIAPDLVSQSEKIDELKISVNSFDNPISIAFNLENNKYIKYQDGIVATSTSNTYSCTDYLDVSKFRIIAYKKIDTVGDATSLGIAFYTKNKTYISGEPNGIFADAFGYRANLYRVNIPNNAVYVRLTALMDSTTYGDFAVYGESSLYGRVSEQILYYNIMGDAETAVVNKRKFAVKKNFISIESSGSISTDFRCCNLFGNPSVITSGWSTANLESQTFYPINFDPLLYDLFITVQINNIYDVNTNYIHVATKNETTGTITKATVLADGLKKIRKINLTDLCPDIATNSNFALFTESKNTGKPNSFVYSFELREKDLSEQITGIKSMLATEEATTTASKAYSVNEFLILNGTLYKVTANIANGGTITVGTNVTATTIGAEITAILNS